VVFHVIGGGEGLAFRGVASGEVAGGVAERPVFGFQFSVFKEPKG
jgi:hypothetical protein